MNEENLNMQVRRFLKKVGIQSQREIEDAVRKAMGDGRIAPGQSLSANVRLTVSGLDLEVHIPGEIAIE